ncbi:MAG TPA: sigma-70 family RNA polymerase sigma factor [Actinomycetota bacterium]|nr:sigma-70 family RNA polymerase sigma factor [Actinomycetota bacterium]
MDLSGATDEHLLERFLRGDAAAFTALARRHEDRVFSVALRMTGNRADALDATQDTLFALFKRAASFRGESAFTTWLYRIALNASRDVMRKRARAPVATDDEILEASAPPPGPDHSEAVVTRLDVMHALEGLTEEYRDAVVLHDLGGLPYEEVAKITAAPVGTVKSRISRGRKALARALEQRAPTRASNLEMEDTDAGSYE